MIYLQTIEDPGDRAKFAELYEHYRAYMLKIAYDILNNTFDAEDALHNAFISISEHMDKVQDVSSKTTRGFRRNHRGRIKSKKVKFCLQILKDSGRITEVVSPHGLK